MPKIVAKKFYLEANRLYARTSNLFIRTKHLPPQSRLSDRQVQLQDYLNAERETRGNGSPIQDNPQQVFTFSATDDVPLNTVLDDFTDLVEPWGLGQRELELESVMVPSAVGKMEGAYQRMVDRSHRGMVRSLVGPPAGVDVATTLDMAALMELDDGRSFSAQVGFPGVDRGKLMRMDRCLSAQGF